MEDRNSRLARENNSLKAALSAKEQEMAAIVKRSVKAEYYVHVAYKDAVEMADAGITCISECLELCKKIRSRLEEHYRSLKVDGKERTLREIDKNATDKSRPYSWFYDREMADRPASALRPRASDWSAASRPASSLLAGYNDENTPPAEMPAERDPSEQPAKQDTPKKPAKRDKPGRKKSGTERLKCMDRPHK